MQKFDDFISLSGDYESRMCPSLCVCHNLNVLIFCQFSAFKEIVESDTFFGRLGESWLEESLKEKVAGDLWYFLSYSLLKIFTDILFITSGILFSSSQVFSFNISII